MDQLKFWVSTDLLILVPAETLGDPVLCKV